MARCVESKCYSTTTNNTTITGKHITYTLWRVFFVHHIGVFCYRVELSSPIGIYGRQQHSHYTLVYGSHDTDKLGI